MTTARQAKEHGMIFSPAMVLALRKSIKTQTRRLLNPQPEYSPSGPSGSIDYWIWRHKKLDCGYCHTNREAMVKLMLPLLRWQVGDIIWVRETFDYITGKVTKSNNDVKRFEHIVYRADGCKPVTGKWTSPRVMPKWASRTRLEITNVQVQRLTEIEFLDAEAEGLTRLSKDDGRTWKYGIPDRDGWPGNDDYGWHWAEWNVEPQLAYASLWDKLNGDKAGCDWVSDPWVAALTFKIMN